MAHPDNMTAIERGIQQTEQLLVQCFRMSERLVMREGHGDSFQTIEAREKSQALIPLVALDIKNSILQMVGIEDAPRTRVDEQQTSLDSLIRALKSRNDAEV